MRPRKTDVHGKPNEVYNNPYITQNKLIQVCFTEYVMC
jgi:hypothetical protein